MNTSSHREHIRAHCNRMPLEQVHYNINSNQWKGTDLGHAKEWLEEYETTKILVECAVKSSSSAKYSAIAAIFSALIALTVLLKPLLLQLIGL